jgi:phosphatidylglycerol:prolipoprotein diacylglycerol transferase
MARRFVARLRPGDLLLVFFIWYGSVRFAVETLKADNWTFFGIPMAMLISAVVVIVALGILVLRHRGRPPIGLDPPASEGAST